LDLHKNVSVDWIRALVWRSNSSLADLIGLRGPSRLGMITTWTYSTTPLARSRRAAPNASYWCLMWQRDGYSKSHLPVKAKQQVGRALHAPAQKCILRLVDVRQRY
jgi:hypothetical protein